MRFAIIFTFYSIAAWAQGPEAAPAKPAPPKPARFVPPARILSFSAKSANLQPGQETMLIWATENPNGVTIDPDLGRVTPRGSRQVKPAATTTYTLTVTGPNNQKLTQSVTINVAGTQPRVLTSEATPKKTPRMPDGKPDLSGVYNFGAGGGRGANPDGQVLKAGAEKFKVVRGANDTGLYADCMPTGVPQAYSVPYQWQIVQGQDKVVIVYEYPHLFRIIPTHGGPHAIDPDPTWMGDSIAHWEGETLVVDVVGFNDKTELPGGYKHTEALHVIERFTRTDFNSLHYEATVEDPNVFEKPWTMVRNFTLRPDLERVDEFVCENNRDYSSFFKK